MKIKYIEKSTFVDYPGKIACTIFLYGCSFRCGFCYNPSLVIKEENPDIDKEKVLDFLKTRIGLIEGVCFTGGEPLMTLTNEFLQDIKSLGYKIKIDTNGSYPEKLKELISLKLIDYVAMDIKDTKETYQETIGIKFPIEKIEESIKIISQLPEYEFRTTFIESIHAKNKIENMFSWINSVIGGKIKTFTIQGFENTGDFIDNKFKQEKNTSENYLNEIKEIAKNYAEKVNIRN